MRFVKMVLNASNIESNVWTTNRMISDMDYWSVSRLRLLWLVDTVGVHYAVDSETSMIWTFSFQDMMDENWC